MSWYYRFNVTKQHYEKVFNPRAAFGIYRTGAKTRGHDFKLTRTEFYRLVDSACIYCGKSPSYGVDRLDSEIGYLPENCAPCCKVCNKMKATTSLAAFVAHARSIASHYPPALPAEPAGPDHDASQQASQDEPSEPS